MDKSPRRDFVRRYMNDRGFRILKAMDQVAKKHDATAASVAIAWLLARPGITAPIASVSKPEQLKSLIKGTTLKLDDVSIGRLNWASAY